MITRLNLIKSRWAHCVWTVLVVFAGLLLLIGLAAARSQQAAGQQNVQPAVPLAANRYVAKTGADAGACTSPLAPCATLQYAIDRAGTGDSVLVATGVYTDVNTYGGLAQVGYITKTIDLRGGYNPGFNDWNPDVYTTTLDAGGQGRVLYITGSITTTVEGFVITHGDSSGLSGPPEDEGGGIYIITAAATISNCKITNNHAYGGAGIAIDASPESIIQNNLLAENQAFTGSGVLLILSQGTLMENVIVNNATEEAGSVSIFNASATLDHNTISRNTDNGFYAGGVYSYNSSMTLTHNTITENEAAGIFRSGSTGVTNIISNTISGNNLGILCWTCSNTNMLDNQINDNTLSNTQSGGIYIGFANSNVTISGNTIRGNHSANSSGGITIFHGNHFIITENIISDNSHRNDGGSFYDNSGGGIYADSVTDITIANNSITANQAAQDGGGIYIYDSYPATVRENTISNNQAGRHGGGLYLSHPAYMIVSRNTITNNTAHQVGGGIYSDGAYEAPTFTSNLITHNEAGNTCGGLALGHKAALTNNLVADNYAGVHGSGLCLDSEIFSLQHNTFANNTGGDGSGIYASTSGTRINMVNTILVSQTVGMVVNSGVQASLDSTLWHGNSQDWAGSGTVTAINNYTGDPAFTAPITGDYHIRATSAAKDIGVDAGVFTDFEGNPRPVDGGFDLGFDEYMAKVDFTLHKQAFPERFQAGDPLTYVLSFANQGNITATQVLITDILPVELEGYAITSTTPITSTGGAPYTWEVATLEPGAGGVITITGYINGSLPEGYVFTNTAQITTTASVNVVHRSDDIARAVVHTNSSPLAVDDVFTAPEDTLLLVNSPGVIQNDQDADGDALTAILDTDPITGELDFHSNGGFSYLPPASYNGVITFTYHLSDGLASSNSALVLVNILHVNHPPIAISDVYTTSEDILLQINPPGVIQNDQDADGDALTAILDTDPIIGDLDFHSNGGFFYLPPANYDGVITFTYYLSDGLASSNSALVLINIVPVNDPPIAVDDIFTTSEDTLLQINAPGVIQNDQDADGDVLTALLDTEPITGELALQPDGGFTYQPPANYNGVITFTYYLSDGLAYSNVALVYINITLVNDPPLAIDDLAATFEDTPVAVAVLANDLDIDGDPLNLSGIGQPVHGAAAISGTLAAYTPEPGFFGQDVFTYTISDGQGGEDSAVVTISVEAVNAAPIVEAGEYQVVLEGEFVHFIGSFTDYGRNPKGEKSPGTGETITWDFGDGLSASGTLTPTHPYGDDGNYTVTLTIMDSDGAVGQDWLAVMVNNVAPSLAALPDQILRVGQWVTVTGVFTDPGWLDAHQVVVEWETGITESISLSTGARHFNLEHVYAQAGNYLVTLWIIDDDRGMDARNFEIVVIPWRVYLPVIRK